MVSVLLWLAAVPCWPAEGLTLSAEDRAWIAAHPVIRIQMGDNSPPFEFRADGRWQGLAHDLLQAACRELGLRVEVQTIGWDDAIANIGAGNRLDLILAVTRSPEREQQMLLTRGYVSFPQVIIADRRRSFISGLSDLRHATITVEPGYVMEGWLRRDLPEARLICLPDSLGALKTVSDGMADAYVGNLGVATWLIDQHSLVNLGVVAPSGYGAEEYAMGVRKDWPELVSLLDRAFLHLSPDEQQAIRQRWLAVRYDHGLRTRDVVLWVLMACTVALLFIIQLRRMVAARTRDLAQEVALRREREHQLAEAQRIAHLGSWSRDLTTGALEGSPELHRILAWPPGSQFSLEGYLALVHAEDRERLLAAHRLEAEGRDPGEIDYRIIRPSGETRQLLRRSSILRDQAGQPTRAQGVILDITERSQLEERLRVAQRMESLGQLAGSVAHDFNNILTAILGYAELIRLKVGDPIARDLSKRIASAIDQAHALTSHLLTFARQGIVRAEPFDAHVAITATLDLVQAMNHGHLKMVTDLAATVPVVHGFPGQFQSALLNLWVNARDAMPAGGTVTLTTANERIDEPARFAPYQLQAGPFLLVRVTDTGTGMEPAVLARCLEPLFTTKGERGTGLGLAGVLTCIIDHGGALRIDSAPGQGTTVSLWLPQAGPPAA